METVFVGENDLLEDVVFKSGGSSSISSARRPPSIIFLQQYLTLSSVLASRGTEHLPLWWEELLGSCVLCHTFSDTFVGAWLQHAVRRMLVTAITSETTYSQNLRWASLTNFSDNKKEHTKSCIYNSKD